MSIASRSRILLASGSRARYFSLTKSILASDDGPHHVGTEKQFAFDKREKAQEDFFMREREKEKFRLIRKSLGAAKDVPDKHRKELDELLKHLDDVEKENSRGSE